MKSESYREERPWGNFVRFTDNEPSTVKIVTVKPGQALSLQFHKNREEFWTVLSGDGEATIGTEKKPAAKGDQFFVAKGVQHRLQAGSDGVEILEISFGDFDEKDIVRLEDNYGRAL